MLKSEKKELRKSKFIAKLNFQTVTYIYGDKVVILSLETEVIGLIIENKNIADTQRRMFDFLWGIAKL